MLNLLRQKKHTFNYLFVVSPKAFKDLSMKILFCSPTAITNKLGTPKILIELTEELEKLGWNCKIIGPSDIVESQNLKKYSRLEYAQKLRQYLHKYAVEYDVVDYDHEHLPYPRTDFNNHTLFVARSSLLIHHFKNIKIPHTKKIKSRIRSLVLGKFDEVQARERLRRAQKTVEEADLVNVLNEDDKQELIKTGISDNKIVVFPNAISQERRALFNAVSSVPPLEPKVAFVGTFDNRKGAYDFPVIIQHIINAVPKVNFCLMGTYGLYQTVQEVLTFFPKNLVSCIDVIPKFYPNELPELLSSCSVGIFPSYVEGFPFGVLEMLAASVPVIAYNSPGSPMMLPPEYLVFPGDTTTMSKKVINLLTDTSKLATTRIWAKNQSQQFCWQKVAKQTSQIYLEHWRKKQLIT